MKIWYAQPTADWNEGLPIGNGSLGAMIYGSPEKEIDPKYSCAITKIESFRIVKLIFF